MSALAVEIVQGPFELFDCDLNAEHWLRFDLAATPAQAKHRCNVELEADWTSLRCERVWCKENVECAAEMATDGIAEPYDGWGWTSATPDEPGAVCYWHVWVKRP